MSKHKILQLNKSDWEKFKEIKLKATQENPEAFGVSLDELVSKPDSYWIDQMKQRDIFVVEEDQRYVSLVIFKKDNDGIWAIKSLWTDPVQRGRGFAKILIERVLDVAKNRNISEIELGVNVVSTNAIDLYKSLGFKLKKTLHNIEMGDGSLGNLQVMRLDLKTKFHTT